MGGCHLDQVELGEIERRLGQAPAPGVDIEHSAGKLGVEGSENAVAHFALRDGSGGRGLAMSPTMPPKEIMMAKPQKTKRPVRTAD
jgi:hypothetical protein